MFMNAQKHARKKPASDSTELICAKYLQINICATLTPYLLKIVTANGAAIKFKSSTHGTTTEKLYLIITL